MAMERVVDMEVDPEFNIHTSYHNDFFFLKLRVTVNGENTQIKSVKEGSYEEPTLVYGNNISAKLWLITNTISPTLHKFGVYHMDTFYYEQSPLFHVAFSSESSLKKFLLEMERIKYAMQVALLSIFLESDSSHNLLVEVHPELFLVSPRRQKMKRADLHLITTENCSTFTGQWKNSKLFDFGSLYQEVADPPCITTHPKGLKDAAPGQPVTFTVRATGTEPISYQWQWKPPAGDDQGESEDWKLCGMEWSHNTTLKIPSVQKLNEGSYQCVVSNCACRQISNTAKLSVADPPCITTHPKGLKDAVPGQPVLFTVHATGTEPISYQWQWTLVGSGDESKKEVWQWCDVKKSDTSTLTISSVQKANEGSYQCVISNCAGSQSSDPAILSVAEHPSSWDGSQTSILVQANVADPPRITTHPKPLKDVVSGKPAIFTIQVTGTQPLSYQWKHQPRGGSEEWQVCDLERFLGSESSTLTIPSAQTLNEGSYLCTVRNCAGSDISESATLTVAEPPKITTHPKESESIFPGKSVSFTVQATGTKPLKYQWQWKPAGEAEKGSEEWQNISCDGSTFQQVGTGLKLTGFQACNAGYYRCVVSNSAGSETSQYINVVAAATLADLVNELQDVNNWIPFGLNLGIDISRLEAIEMQCCKIEECRTQLLIYWQKQVVPTWSAVVKALMAIGMRRLASEIAQKHEVPVPMPPNDEPLEQLVNHSQQGESKAIRSVLLADVQKCRVDIRNVDVEIMDTKKQLRDSQTSKASIHENINQILCSISKLREKVQSIAHERNITKEKLESKQRECQLLSEMRDLATASMRDSKKHQEKEEAYRILVEEKNAKKRKNIDKLEQELWQKDSDLQSAQEEARSLDEKLLQARAELETKHKEMQQLQKENEELVCSYNIEKEKVSKLVQITVAVTAGKKIIEQQLMTTEDESDLISQQIEACNSSITSLSEKVEALSCSLKEKKATAAQLQSELQSSHQPVSSKTEQLLELLKLQPQIAELECKLQKAECKKQQAVLEKRSIAQEMEARKKLEVRLRAQLDLTTRDKTEESEARPPSRLQLPLTLRWKRCRDMPCAMADLQSVTVRQKVFVGGGFTDSFYGDDVHTVYEYNEANNKWISLPRYNCVRFAMMILTDKLTLVGGFNTSTGEATNQVAVCEGEGTSRGWTHPYPPMTTPRRSPAIATYGDRLVVAGGRYGVDLATVEVLNTTSHQWLSASPLPVGCSSMTSVIVNQELFLLGGTLPSEALVVSLPDIMRSSVHSTTTNRSVQWHSLPAPPLERSATLSLCGSVLAIGGNHGNKSSTAIYVYQPATNNWNKIGDLPCSRYACSSTLLPSGHILVARGFDSNGKRTSRVDTATL